MPLTVGPAYFPASENGIVTDGSLSRDIRFQIVDGGIVETSGFNFGKLFHTMFPGTQVHGTDNALEGRTLIIGKFP